MDLMAFVAMWSLMMTAMMLPLGRPVSGCLSAHDHRVSATSSRWTRARLSRRVGCGGCRRVRNRYLVRRSCGGPRNSDPTGCSSDVLSRRGLSAQPSQVPMPKPLPHPGRPHAPLPRVSGNAARCSSWLQSRLVLPGLLLGVDGVDGRIWGHEHRCHGCPHCHHRDREGLAPRRTVRPHNRGCFDRLRGGLDLRSGVGSGTGPRRFDANARHVGCVTTLILSSRAHSTQSLRSTH